METYKIVRFFQRSNRKVVLYTGRTLEQAQEYCSDPETSSSTATAPDAKARTRRSGPWFDGFRKE